MSNQKKSKKDIEKQIAFYNKKLEYYKTKTSAELKEIFNSKKFSASETEAIIQATDYVLKQEGLKNIKENDSNG